MAATTLVPSLHAEEMTDKPEMKKEMRQEIKSERKEMNQEIKDDRMKMKQENKDNRHMMGSGMHMPTAELKDFLRNPLTADEQVALKAIMKAHHADHETLMKDAALTPEEKMAKMKELMTAHVTAMLPYISAEKVEAFKKMMEERMAMMGKKHEIREENKENREEFKEGAKEKRQEFRGDVKEKRKALSEKLQKQLVAALDKLPLEKIQKVLVNVDAAMARIKASSLVAEKKDRVLAQLQDIKDMVQDRIDELTNGTSDASLLEEVLGGTVPVTGTGTNQ